jgi:hypothetical protein
VLKQFHIQLTDRLKKPQTSNRFVSGLLNILSVILYPIILLIGLVTILFAAIISLFQKMPSQEGKEKLVDKEQTLNETWSVLTEQGNLKIFKKFAGEVRFGPAYLHLKSDPIIPLLTDKFFGDWFFHFDNMLLLQQWNSTDKPNTNLVGIDTLTFDTNVLIQSIPSVLWDIVETEANDLQLTCDTGTEILKYSIKRAQSV